MPIMAARCSFVLLAVLIFCAAGCSSTRESAPVFPLCFFTSGPLDFGTVQLGDSTSLNIRLLNTSRVPIAGVLRVSPVEFHVVGDSAFQLAPGASRTWPLQFHPRRPGARSCAVSAWPFGARQYATGTGGPGEAACRVRPAHLDFGVVTVGDSLHRSFTLSNDGTAWLDGSVTLPTAAFHLERAAAFSIAPGESLEVRVGFAPQAAGAHNGVLRLAGAGCGELQVYAAATGQPVDGYLAWGSPGTGDGQFSGVSSVAVGPNGDVYVADDNTARVQRFTRDGVFVSSFGSRGTGPGQFATRACGLAVDGRGDVYVLDEGAHRVQKFTADGAPVWARPVLQDVVTLLAVATDGDTLVFVHTGASIGMLGASGVTLKRIRGEAFPGGAHAAIAATGAGRLYVADPFRATIAVSDTSAAPWDAWDAPCLFDLPHAVAVDPAGYVYVTDGTDAGGGGACYPAAHILRLTADGQPSGIWGANGAGMPSMLGVAAVAASRDGFVYAADRLREKIHRIPASRFAPLAGGGRMWR